MSGGPLPFKVVAVEPGNASVIDRTSGERVGYVLADFHGNWHAYVVTEPRGRLLGTRRFRAEAALLAWATYEPLPELRRTQ